MKMSAALMVVTLGSLSLPAIAGYGTPSEGWGFVQDDWQVVCDNTRTCRVAGYSTDAAMDNPASVLFTVLPKVATPKAQIQLASKTSTDKAELWLNNKNYGTLHPVGSDTVLYDLSTKQTQAIIDKAHIHNNIEVRAGNNRWRISDRGISAVMLRLDEVQGRVGTSIALISKGNSNQQTPKAALPVPTITKAFAYSNKDNKMLTSGALARFQKNIDKWVNINSKQLIGSGNTIGDCELVNPKTEAYKRMSEYGSSMLGWDFIPVDKSHTLATHLCWSGPYNSSTGYWLINNDSPSTSKLITTAGNEYEEGEISAVHKDRGIGDCWNHATWTWNGSTFVKSEEASTGLCRGFVGGAWGLPTYVSQIITK